MKLVDFIPVLYRRGTVFIMFWSYLKVLKISWIFFLVLCGYKYCNLLKVVPKYLC